MQFFQTGSTTAGSASASVAAAEQALQEGVPAASEPMPQILDAEEAPEAPQQQPKECKGLGLEETHSKDQDWPQLYKAYLHFVQGGPRASSKFSFECVAGNYRAKAQECTGTGLKWQHGVLCCKACHKVRTGSEQVAKTSIWLWSKCGVTIFLLSDL